MSHDTGWELAEAKRENADLRQQLSDRWEEIDGLNDQAAELLKQNAAQAAELATLRERLEAATCYRQGSITVEKFKDYSGDHWDVTDSSKSMAWRRIGTYKSCDEAFIAAGWLPQDEAKGGGR